MNPNPQFQTILDAALEYAAFGWHVFPIPPGTKSGYSDLSSKHTGRNWGASTDPAIIVQMWNSHPEANVGIATGAASGLLVIEADTLEGHDADGVSVLKALIAANGGIPDTIQAKSPSGSWHLYFRYPTHCDIKTVSATNGLRGIDVRGHGGMVLAPPSIKPGKPKPYSWINPPGFFELAECPKWLLDLCEKREAAKPSTGAGADGFKFDTGHADPAGCDEVWEILGHIPPDCGYSDWCAVLMGLHDKFGGSDAGLNVADQWSAGGAKYQPREVAAKWRGFKIGGGAGWGSVCELARQNGADLKAIFIKHRGSQDGFRAGHDFTAGNGGAATSDGEPRPNTDSRTAGTAAGDGKLAGFDLIKDNRGRTVWCAENACIVLEQSPAWAGVFAYDEFGGLTMLQKPLPGSTVPKSTYRPRPITDADMTAVLRWFNRNGFPDGTRQTVTDAVDAVARANTFSPVQDYLHGLTWDGKPRAGAWLTTYCGAVPSSLTDKQGQAWLISAVARALNPGCKADCALVLEGQQGAGKSSAISILAGDDWFYDGLHDLHSKDASAGLRGKWIIELPELSAMRRTETEGVKAFLSCTTERYRPAYGRCEVIEPRRCVFAGTTNRTDWLTDDTGGRRFWPVALGKVDLQALARDRDQIWAEAVALYKGDAKWWLDREDEASAAAAVALRAADDPWSADVLAIAEGLADVSTRDIFQRLDFQKERWGKAETMRVAGILARAGWTHAGKFTGGANRGLARYLPPSRGGK